MVSNEVRVPLGSRSEQPTTRETRFACNAAPSFPRRALHGRLTSAVVSAMMFSQHFLGASCFLRTAAAEHAACAVQIQDYMQKIQSRLTELSQYHSKAVLPNFDEFSGEEQQVEVRASRHALRRSHPGLNLPRTALNRRLHDIALSRVPLC